MIASSAIGQDQDSLLIQLDKLKGADRIATLQALTVSNWLKAPELAKSYVEESLKLARESEDQGAISRSTRLLAGVHYYLGNYEQALDYNLQALGVALEIGDSVAIHNGYNNNGLLYYNLGSYQTALEYLLRSQLIKEQIKDTFSLPTTLNNIGLIFDRVGQAETALLQYRKALKIAISVGYTDQEIHAMNNMGTTFIKQGKLDTAKVYFQRAHDLAARVGNSNFGAVAGRGLGEVCMYKGGFDSARLHLMGALKASTSIHDQKGITESYYLLAKLELILGNFKEALIHLNESHERARQLKLGQQLLENLKLYVIIFQQNEDEKNIILYQSKYSNLRDSLLQEVVVRNLALIPLKIKEETDRTKLLQQETEIELKNKENQLFIIIIIISIPLSGFLIILLIKNRKARIILKDKNERLIQAQSHIITSEKMASLGSLAAGIGHEINNPLNFIKNGSLIVKNKLASQSPQLSEELKPFIAAIDEGVTRAANIVKSLSHFSRVGVDLQEICNVNDVLKNCLLVIKNRLREKSEVRLNLTEAQVFVQGNEGKLHQAFLNILTNAEQAIEENGLIEITTKTENGFVRVSIKDNGSGISEENLKMISNPFFTTKETGVGTGLGLFITYSIIDEHDGAIKVSSKLNEETEFVVSLPLV